MNKENIIFLLKKYFLKMKKIHYFFKIILNFIKFDKNDIFKILEITIITIGLFFAYSELKIIINSLEETKKQTKGIYETLELQRKISKIQVVSEINKDFYSEKNYKIFLYLKEGELEGKYEEFEMIKLLDNFEFLAWLYEEKLLNENDIRVNYAGYMRKICKSKYFQGLAKREKRSGFKNVCSLDFFKK